MHFRIALCLLVCTIYGSNADVDIITEPRPGEEYVLVSSGQQTPLRTFETSHKIPEKHPQHHVVRPEEPSEKINKKLHSGKIKYPSEGIIAIEEDKKSSYAKKGQKNKAAESIEIDVPVSKLEDIKIRENIKDVDTNPKMAVDLETISESGKLSNNPGTTTQKPILTTDQPTTKGYDYIPINFDSIDDINSGLLSSNAKLETAGSEQKQHSRIQIKKGPNGQDYEYEYIYYYYDEDEEPNKKETKEKSTTTTAAPVHNAHDGPQKAEHENQISREGKSKSKYSTIERTSTTATTTTTAAPHEIQNEVVHTNARGRQRGRPAVPAPVEEEIEGDRLPSSTRFPPRGRNLAAASHSSTTHVPEVPTEPIVKPRGRSSVDSVADESIGQTRSRTRAHIRRPSSELVDLDSFKTHSGDIPSQYKELPSKYSTESRSTTESQEIATEKDISFVRESPREGHSISSGIRFQEILDDSKLPADYKQTTTYEPETTEYTTMTAMEKVALDLYAYLAGENLNNEINPTNDSPVEGSTTVEDASTTEVTTEEATTSTTTTPAPTTTTTQATTTTTTTAAPTRPSRFKGRPLAKGRASTTTTTTTTTEASAQESSTRARGRFGKPSVRKSTTAASSEPVTTAAPVEKPVQPKTFGRRGFFAGRTRPSASTAAPAAVQDASTASEAVSEPATPRPRLRPNLRRTTTTAAPSAAPTGEDASPSSSNPEQTSETTPAPQGSRTIGRSRPNLRPAPLRPGARLNIRTNPRLRGGASTATPEAASEAPVETSAPESAPTEQQQEQEPEGGLTPAPETPRTKLRTRLQVSASPRPRVAVTAPARRPNPLLKRKQLSTEAPTEATKKPTEATEESTSAEKSETETEAQPAETTPAPPLRGLDALIARRRASGGIGARPSRPVRGAKHPK